MCLVDNWPTNQLTGKYGSLHGIVTVRIWTFPTEQLILGIIYQTLVLSPTALVTARYT